jgi:branched-chain amino acid transport system substrate-binding protein
MLKLRRSGVAALLLSALALAGCGAPTESAAGRSGGETEAAPEVVEATGEPIKIGLVDSLSGGLGSWGEPNRRGVELGIEYATDGTMVVAGRPVELVVRDDATSPEVGVEAARQLIEVEKVDVIIGTISGAVAKGVSDLAAETGTPYFPLTSTVELTGEWFNEYTFRTSFNAYSLMNAAVHYVDESAPEANWVHLAPDFAFGYSMDAAFQEALTELGPEMAHTTVFAPMNTTDFTPYLQKAKEAAPTHLLANWVTEGVALLNQQMNDAGLGQEAELIGVLQPLAGNGVRSYEHFIGALGLTGYYWDFVDTPVNKWFVDRHREEYNEPPDANSGPAFAAVHAYLEAVQLAEGDTDPAKLIPLLEGMTLDTIWEGMHIRAEDHQALVPMYVARVENVDDTDHRYLSLVSEIGAEAAAPPCEVEDRC